MELIQTMTLKSFGMHTSRDEDENRFNEAKSYASKLTLRVFQTITNVYLFLKQMAPVYRHAQLRSDTLRQ